MSVRATKTDIRTAPQEKLKAGGLSIQKLHSKSIYCVVLNFFNKPLFWIWPTSYNPLTCQELKSQSNRKVGHDKRGSLLCQCQAKVFGTGSSLRTCQRCFCWRLCFPGMPQYASKSIMAEDPQSVKNLILCTTHSVSNYRYSGFQVTTLLHPYYKEQRYNCCQTITTPKVLNRFHGYLPT